MTAEEVPLVAVDTSFLENGSAGLLLTNRCLYSSELPDPVPLATIREARVEHPDTLDHILYLLGLLGWLFRSMRGTYYSRLVVNDDVVYNHAKPIRYEFWVDVLTRLAAASRLE
jgi:hypothetical protein